MPAYRVFVLEDFEGSEGREEVWNLPWERLVFDQRFDHARQRGAEPLRWVVREIRAMPEGELFVVAPNPGTLRGGDPKKHRVP
ncbi:MAG: hypothetical protein R3F30_02165 [Planctomycetota bacterium]